MRFTSVMLFAAASLGAASVASAEQAAPATTTLSMSGSFAPVSGAQFSAARFKKKHDGFFTISPLGTILLTTAISTGLSVGITQAINNNNSTVSCLNARGSITPCPA